MKTSLHQPAEFGRGLALLILVGGMLLSTSGTQASAHRGAVLVKDIRPGSSPSITTNGGGNCGCIYNGGDLTDLRGTLYFSANDGKHGFELWRSDGTRAGTTVVRDIRRGTSSSEPTNLTAVGGSLYFTAKDGRHNRELWRAGPRPCTTAKGKCKKKG